MGRKICQHWLQIEIFLFFILNHTIGQYAIMVKFCSQVLLNLFFDTQILAFLSLIFMLVKSALVAITIVS